MTTNGKKTINKKFSGMLSEELCCPYKIQSIISSNYYKNRFLSPCEIELFSQFYNLQSYTIMPSFVMKSPQGRSGNNNIRRFDKLKSFFSKENISQALAEELGE